MRAPIPLPYEDETREVDEWIAEIRAALEIWQYHADELERLFGQAQRRAISFEEYQAKTDPHIRKQMATLRSLSPEARGMMDRWGVILYGDRVYEYCDNTEDDYPQMVSRFFLDVGAE